MNIPLFRLPNKTPERTRSAIFVIAVYLIGSAIASSYLMIQALRVASWQSWVVALSVLAMVISSIVALVLVRRNRVELGIWILMIASYIAAFGVITAISGMGVIVLAAAIFLSSMVAVETLQSRQSVMFITGIVVGIAALLFDFSIKTQRLSIPVFQNLSYFLVPLMAILFGIVIIRQYRNYSLRNKLMVAFIGVTLGTAAILSVYIFTTTTNTLRQGLERELQQHTDGVASNVSALFNEQVAALTTLSLNRSLQEAAVDTNASYKGDANTIQTILDQRDAQWKAANAADNNDDPLVHEYLSNFVSQELVEFQRAFPNHVEVFLTDQYGGLIGATNRTSDYYQADEDWWQAAYNNGNGAIYISNPKYDQSSNTFAIQIALPIHRHETDQLVGIMRTTYQTSALIPILGELIGETGKTELYIPGSPAYVIHQGQLDPADPNQLNKLQAIAGQGMIEMDYVNDNSASNSPTSNSTTPSVVTQTSMKDLGEDTEFNRLGWTVVFHQNQDEAYAPINAGIRGAVIVLVIVVFLAVAGAYVLSSFLVGPITHLTRTAEEIAAGNLNSRTEVSSTDEIGVLATSFNSMTSQLQNTLQGLEQRVADRTRNLELAAEVGRSISQVRSLDVMLKDACELILKEFNLYYVQVYLTDVRASTLKLEAGTGNVGTQLLGRGHSLPINSASINGRAATEKRSVVISDTTQSTTFRKNPLLPETQGEMAVPLIVADKVVGVLDMQSSEPGVLSQEILPAFEALAGQLAVAVQNANLLAETEEARSEVEKQARRLVRARWNEHLDAIHKPEQLGFVFDRHQVSPLVDANEPQLPENGNAISAPIAVTGESLGSLVVELSDGTHREQTSELVNIVARQVAQQVENLRLLESAERYRAEAEKGARLQTIEGWQKYIETRSAENLGYLYDTNEVRPKAGWDEDASMFAMPLKARDQMIGKLSVEGLTYEDQESVELVNAVAERLSAHIENLRLLEETQRGQIELSKRAQREQTLRQITSALRSSTDPETIMRTAVRELGSILARRTVVQMMSPEQDAQVKPGKNGDGSAPVAGSTESA